MSKKTLLQLADDITTNNSLTKNKYGTFQQNFTDAAAIASILTNSVVTPDIANAVLIGLKIARLRSGYHEDSFLDLHAYIAAFEINNPNSNKSKI
jgi:hypothetical protein|tara:strand:- start:6500 stop:6784 length:285 start_codon:yes stop_codon:yes gene_type:complete